MLVLGGKIRPGRVPHARNSPSVRNGGPVVVVLSRPPQYYYYSSRLIGRTVKVTAMGPTPSMQALVRLVNNAGDPSGRPSRGLGHAIECKKAPKQKKRSLSRGGNFKPFDPENGATGLANNITPIGRSLDGSSRLGTLSICRTLVLDCSLRPIDVVSWQRAICLDLFKKADVLEYYEQEVRASRESFPVPAVLKVRFFMKPSKAQLPCARRYVLMRDNFTCQYCGCKSNLTMDHVHPVSKGGSWGWENLVTACTSCNSKKGNRTLAQVGWKLLKTPKAPHPFEVEVVAGMTHRDILTPPSEWCAYLQPDLLDRLYPGKR